MTAPTGTVTIQACLCLQDPVKEDKSIFISKAAAAELDLYVGTQQCSTVGHEPDQGPP